MSLHYQIFITRDGSPTLILPGAESGVEEKMHHSDGALSESLFVYREALLEALRREWPARILSLGLGLGYNELIAIATCLERGIQDFKIWSFESEEFLRDSFRRWLENGDGELNPTYARILDGVAEAHSLNADALKTSAADAFANGRLELRARFPDEIAGVTGASCIFYDAFSKKMNPGLWQEDALFANLEVCAGGRCVLSTYAATGALNRALKRLGFRLLEKSGFSGKRESTLAIREEIR